MTKLEENLTKRVTSLEAELKAYNKASGQHPQMVGAVLGHGPFIKMFRFFARNQLMARGYDKENATRMVKKIGDGKILELIKKYGPMVLKIFLAILPLLLALEPAPTLQAHPDMIVDKEDDADEAVFESTN